MERNGAFRGRYHVLGGTLSALDGLVPTTSTLTARRPVKTRPRADPRTNATVEGQTTAHYLADRVAGRGITVSRLAQGVPIGGELDYLDDGTLDRRVESTAFVVATTGVADLPARLDAPLT